MPRKRTAIRRRGTSAVMLEHVPQDIQSWRLAKLRTALKLPDTQAYVLFADTNILVKIAKTTVVALISTWKKPRIYCAWYNDSDIIIYGYTKGPA